jgi:hypothetical protein
MSVTTLRERVMGMVGKPTTPALLCITGASGAGKTTAVAALRERIEARVLPALELDSLGVPSHDEMVAAWESPRGWQKAMTWHWVYTAKHVYRTHPLVVLEGQFDPQYAIAACSAHRMRNAVLLLHADDSVRRDRLERRGQGALATPEMREWASYLRESTQQLGGIVIDACGSIDSVVDAICAHAVTLVDALAEDVREPRDPRERGRRRHN